MVKIFTIQERIHYLKQFGSHCIAFSTLQPGMEYFDVLGIGYLAYMKKGKTRLVLGDPICAKENREKIIALALKEYKHTSFYQISKSAAELLHRKFGFYINIFGTEAHIFRSKVWQSSEIELEKEYFNLNQQLITLIGLKDRLFEEMNSNPSLKKDFWRVKREVQDVKRKLANLETVKENQQPLVAYLKRSDSYHIRRQYSSAIKAGVKIFEEKISEDNKDQIEKISKQWISTKKVSSSEMRFFTRPLTLEFDSNLDTRLFTAKDINGKMLGFLILDPLYDHGQVIGYFPDLLRTLAEVPTGTGYLLLIAAMDSIFNEGYEIFNLGLSPFHKISPVHFRKREADSSMNRVDNKLMTFIFDNFFKYGGFFYNTKSQAFHKERFGGNMIRTFCATKKKMPLQEIFEGFSVSGISLLEQLKKL